MLLKKLIEKKLIVVCYYKNGEEKTCRGHFHRLDKNSQTLFLRDEKNKIHSLFLGEVKEFN